MMKHLFLWCFFLLTLWNTVSAKSIQKRDNCSNNCGTCNGNTCNVCSSCTNTCSSSTCNSCVNQCSNNCNTVQCKNNCVSGCSNTCQTQTCPVQTCSQCVNKCSNQCSTDSCVNDCTSKCDCKEKERPYPPYPDQPVIIEPPQPSSVIVNNTNNNVVNLTTHINIDNVVNNFNNISVPIYVNTTNINNIDVTNIENKNESASHVVPPYPQPPQPHPPHPQPPPIPYPIPYPVFPPYNPNPTPTENCCYVMHPRQCYTDEGGNSRCYIRRHRECSNACTSPVITIQENERSRGCFYTQNYPYVYCGNYERTECGQCYNCNGNYNPSECFRGGGCPDACRRSVPNCVPSQSGLQCY